MRDPAAMLDRCSRRYGETFTVRLLWAEPITFSADLELIRELLADDRGNRVSPGREATLKPVMGPRSIFFAHGDSHLELRRLMSPPLQGEALPAYAELARVLTRQQVASWPLGQRFELLARLVRLVADVLVGAVFAPRDAARAAELAELFTVMRELNAAGWRRRWARAQKRLGAASRLESAGSRLDELIAAEIGERYADPALGQRADVLSRYARARRPDGRVLEEGELRDQVVSLMMAGHDATAVGLAWTLELLARHPAAERRALADAADGDGSFLAATVRESLRLRPVVPTVGRRLGAARRLGGYELPAGSIVSPSIYLVHTSARHFAAPREFKPERFLEPGGRPGWMPFGGGVRRCLGATLAETLMRAVLAELLPRLELRLVSNGPARVRSESVIWAPARGLPVVASPRRAQA
jgi:cytochrome P450